jgi:hypothetical protein
MLIKKISAAAAAALAFGSGGAAMAGEFGVSNSYGHSWRHGTGNSYVNYVTNIQSEEWYEFEADKNVLTITGGGSITTTETPETPVATGGCNNGFGNGDQCAPGNSNFNNNAENAGGDGGQEEGEVTAGGSGGSSSIAGDFFFSVAEESASIEGAGWRSERTRIEGGANEVYSFGSTNFTHRVSAFAN